MKVSEAGHNPEFESNTREYHVWSHFSAQMFHFCFFHTINFGPVISLILDKVHSYCIYVCNVKQEICGGRMLGVFQKKYGGFERIATPAFMYLCL